MQKIKISAVSYTNTIPFIYGIKQNPEILNLIDLSLDVPSVCAHKLIINQVDIGLVPVAALLDIPNYKIISDYCIGSVGKVTSVFIFSKKPMDEIRTIRLDSQSRTSNNLARVLLQNYWKKEVEIIINGEEEKKADAYVQIGDRTFGKDKTEPYAYDLGEAWTDFSGLPFVYAVWAANKDIPSNFVTLFNEALKFGLDNREEVLKDIPEHKNIDIREYLLNSINYDLDDDKRAAIKLFHHLIGELVPLESQKALC
jgi:chorismate dehydratase